MASVNQHVPSTHVTHEGAPAKRINAEQQLRRSVMACLLWEDSFYEDGVSIAVRLAEAASNVTLEKLYEIAYEARQVVGIRHAPLWAMVSQLSRKQKSGWAETFAKMVRRPDDVVEALALYWKDGRKPLPAQLKEGIALAMPKFSAYQLAKYNRDDKPIKLRDLLFLSHAKPVDETQAEVWKKLIDGELEAPDTWEVALSSGANKKETWERLITERKIGGLALIRNLRNMQRDGVREELIVAALETMKTDLIWPYQFIAAAQHAPQLEPYLEKAMFRALETAPKLPGKTVLLVDGSGSMNDKLSGRSEMTRYDAACGLAILLREVCEHVAVLEFSEQVRLVPPRRGFALRDALKQVMEGGGTYTENAKRHVDGTGYDRIIIITDEQSHQSLSNPLGKGYVINVGAYKNGIGYGKWVHIDGWSESSVRYIATYETLPQ